MTTGAGLISAVSNGSFAAVNVFAWRRDQPAELGGAGRNQRRASGSDPLAQWVELDACVAGGCAVRRISHAFSARSRATSRSRSEIIGARLHAPQVEPDRHPVAVVDPFLVPHPL